MLASDIITEVRPMIVDPAPAIRWLDPELIQYICDALDELWIRRQTAFYLTGIVTTMPAKPTVAGSTVFVQDSYRLPIAHYVSYLCFLGDADDVNNAKLASTHYDLFEKGVM